MKYFPKCYFFVHKFISMQFLYCLGFFILTKSLNTACSLTEMKQNLSKTFSGLVKLININLDEYNLFLNHAK